MLKLFKHYKYMVFCSLHGINVVERGVAFLAHPVYAYLLCVIVVFSRATARKISAKRILAIVCLSATTRYRVKPR